MTLLYQGGLSFHALNSGDTLRPLHGTIIIPKQYSWAGSCGHPETSLWPYNIFPMHFLYNHDFSTSLGYLEYISLNLASEKIACDYMENSFSCEHISKDNTISRIRRYMCPHYICATENHFTSQLFSSWDFQHRSRLQWWEAEDVRQCLYHSEPKLLILWYQV